MAKKRKSPAGPTGRAAAVERPSEWGLLRDEELARPGATLMNLLLVAVAARGLSVAKLIDTLDVSPAYFYGLRSGKNDISMLGDEVIERAARFLGMSKVAAMLAAGQLKPEDFYAEPEKVKDFVQPAFQYVLSDTEIAAYIPATILTADRAIQLCVIWFYERLTGTVLIPGRVPTDEILKRHRMLVQG